MDRLWQGTARLRRATSFRIALFFAGLFGTAALLFAGTLYLLATHFLSGNPDERLRAEAATFDRRPGHIAVRLMDQHSVDDVTGRRPFGLFDAQGRHLAGNLASLPRPLPDDEAMFETRVATREEHTIYRSVLHRLPDGKLVVISRNIEELARFRSELTELTVVGLCLMAFLGVIGGLVVGVGSLHRLDAITLAIERITRGDLRVRLPVLARDDDFDRVARGVNAMLDHIERLMGEVKGVCDSIAHDLRTPLTRLLALLERAHRRGLSPAERAAEIASAIDEVNGMLRTFDALLRISEFEDGARRAAFGEIDLVRVAEDVIEHFEPVAEARGLVLDMAPLASPLPLVMPGDGDLLFEALANLVDNAIKFTPDGGRITLALRMTGDAGPEIRVSDTGCGIPPADRETVLVRFRRGTTSRGTPGNGLGLPLVAAIARLHGLAVRFEDAAVGCVVVLAGEGPLLRGAAQALRDDEIPVIRA